jgi:hypothetical protein
MPYRMAVAACCSECGKELTWKQGFGIIYIWKLTEEIFWTVHRLSRTDRLEAKGVTSIHQWIDRQTEGVS